MDYRQLIEQLNLSDETDNKENLTEVKHFSMDAADFEMVTERKKQKHPHTGPDNRGKYKRTEEQRAALSLMMQELWSDPEFREKMKNCHTGRPRKFKGPLKQDKPRVYKWSEESRKAHGDRQRGTILITNGTECHRHKMDEPIPEGWWRGKPSPSEESRQKTSETMKGLWKVYKETYENGNTEDM